LKFEGELVNLPHWKTPLAVKGLTERVVNHIKYFPENRVETMHWSQKKKEKPKILDELQEQMGT